MRKPVLSALAVVSLALTTGGTAHAQDLPVVPGDWVEVSSITVDDGHDVEYLNYLAETWRKSQDYAVKQGWITGYEILSNEYPSKGEPTLFLITRFKQFDTPAEAEARRKAWEAYMGTSTTRQEASSAERAKYRHQDGVRLLRSWRWAK